MASNVTRRAPSGPKPRHGERVDILSVAEYVLAASSLHLEAKFFVEPDGRLVIDIDRQLEPLQAKPIVGRINERGHERRADAVSVEIVVDCDADVADVVAATLVLLDAG